MGDHGSEAIAECKAWILNQKRSNLIDDILQIFDDEMDEEKREYDAELMIECTLPVLTREEYANCDGNIGLMPIRRIKVVGQKLETILLNEYNIKTVAQFHEQSGNLELLSIKGIG